METTQQSRETLEELAQLANGGDQAAAVSFISQCLPYWMAATRNLMQAQHQADAEDLVQNAIIKLIELWRRGDGPSKNTRSYVVVAIRHAYIDRLRSPRSQVRSLEDIEATADEPASEDIALSADLIVERDMIRRALETLSDDHRLVLQKTVIEGRKPADLTDELDRPAPAISNLINRAKAALRRALLIEYLSDGTTDCVDHAHRLPKRVETSPELHREDDPALAHARDCEACRGNWRRFATVGTLLGVVPLLTLTQLHTSAAPAQAMEAGSSEAEAGTSQGTESGQGPDDATQQHPEASDHSTWVGTALTSKMALVLGLLLALTGGVVAVMQFFAAPDGTVRYEGELIDGNPHNVAFDVEADSLNAADTRALTVTFGTTDGKPWHLEELTLQLTGENELVSFPESLDCTGGGTRVTCHLAEEGRATESFQFTLSEGTPGAFTLDIRAEISGEPLRAVASGE